MKGIMVICSIKVGVFWNVLLIAARNRSLGSKSAYLPLILVEDKTQDDEKNIKPLIRQIVSCQFSHSWSYD